MTLRDAESKLHIILEKLYDSREAANIGRMILEYITQWRNVDFASNMDSLLSDKQSEQLATYTSQLLNGCPIQYIVGEAWFYKYPFFVNKYVLIPRPETEELVEWALQSLNDSDRVMDIGTGSGCIAITIKKERSSTQVYALDHSVEAISVASKNADLNNVPITFLTRSILDTDTWDILPNKLDIIVSNPPYIRLLEQTTMHKNVVDFEPHDALFVPNEDPLLFYRSIAEFGLLHLKENGKIFFEINEALGEETGELLKTLGYSNVILRKDLQGKDRMICATKLLNQTVKKM